ncbi:MAG: hypothetical protein F6J94_05925 [Moorea sp. SIO1F2]|uniref:hypothetical protein n=1 Tax=unclassified Moorena TaxID=2683338 RepID=UPI0013BD55D6|nr:MULTISPECIES: hypothetical protein [unclassified Moorena]NEN94552.1 hypothetical protein [Moorena sp. SIO3I7]NEO06278.1 hypothetical protein [Moorena sp. SIO3I8]NEO20327.1 hypothetical protein [Moorena sp. SIO4A5]NEP25092.1 hypothetical protein [Moorena sp. SIO3I6]NEQ60339.1 hypothetical protein [Moorena sp. SIO4A1]
MKTLPVVSMIMRSRLIQLNQNSLLPTPYSLLPYVAKLPIFNQPKICSAVN